MLKPLRNPQIIWRVEKARQQKVIDALAAGEDVEESGTVILIESGTMHQLNLVGGLIWERCDGDRDIEQIADELAVEFDVERSELVADVKEFVSGLAERGWLVDE